MTQLFGRPTLLPAPLQWTAPGRFIVFGLSTTSIWSGLLTFYGLCEMQTFAIWVLLPASLLMLLMAVLDRTGGNRELFRAVRIGALAGLVAIVAYDIFRLPFVIAAVDKLGPAWLQLPLFKVFPRFGAMILHPGPIDPHKPDSQYSLLAHAVGWVYHLANGLMLGVMYVALIGDPRRRSWLWALALAGFLELVMIVTPFTGLFGFKITPRFVVITLLAQLTFGIVLGLWVRGSYRRHAL